MRGFRVLKGPCDTSPGTAILRVTPTDSRPPASVLYCLRSTRSNAAKSSRSSLIANRTETVKFAHPRPRTETVGGCRDGEVAARSVVLRRLTPKQPFADTERANPVEQARVSKGRGRELAAADESGPVITVSEHQCEEHGA